MLGDRLAGNRSYYMANNLIRPQSPDLDQDSTLKVRLFLQSFFVLASVVSYTAFVLSLFGTRLFFFLCLGKTILRDCDISWVSLPIFLI